MKIKEDETLPWLSYKDDNITENKQACFKHNQFCLILISAQ